MLENEILEKKCPLSPREKEILFLIASGYENKGMAQKLGIELQTVKNTIASATKKLDAPTRTRAVVIALENGWISFPRKDEA